MNYIETVKKYQGVKTKKNCLRFRSQLKVWSHIPERRSCGAHGRTQEQKERKQIKEETVRYVCEKRFNCRKP